MLNTNSTTPHDPFRALVPWAKGIDRLGVMPPASAPPAQPEPLTGETAIARLLMAGLCCQGTSTPRLHRGRAKITSRFCSVG
jgi:hypothetical protein